MYRRFSFCVHSRSTVYFVTFRIMWATWTARLNRKWRWWWWWWWWWGWYRSTAGFIFILSSFFYFSALLHFQLSPQIKSWSTPARKSPFILVWSKWCSIKLKKSWLINSASWYGLHLHYSYINIRLGLLQPTKTYFKIYRKRRSCQLWS